MVRVTTEIGGNGLRLGCWFDRRYSLEVFSGFSNREIGPEAAPTSLPRSMSML